ncbi:MAG: hypothetical protein WC378_15430, partial [Opitutaceae bacterium]
SSVELATAKEQLTAAVNEKTLGATQLQTRTAELEASRTALATERSARADLVLTSAINEGRITQAERPEWQGKLVANGADFAAISTELSTKKKAVNTSDATKGLGARKGESTVSKTKIAAINEAVSKKMSDAKLSHLDAFAALRTERPELFSNAAS